MAWLDLQEGILEEFYEAAGFSEKESRVNGILTSRYHYFLEKGRYYQKTFLMRINADPERRALRAKKRRETNQRRMSELKAKPELLARYRRQHRHCQQRYSAKLAESPEQIERRLNQIRERELAGPARREKRLQQKRVWAKKHYLARTGKKPEDIRPYKRKS